MTQQIQVRYIEVVPGSYHEEIVYYTDINNPDAAIYIMNGGNTGFFYGSPNPLSPIYFPDGSNLTVNEGQVGQPMANFPATNYSLGLVQGPPVVIATSDNLLPQWNQMLAAAAQIGLNGAPGVVSLPYDLLQLNSNSVASTLLAAAGLNIDSIDIAPASDVLVNIPSLTQQDLNNVEQQGEFLLVNPDMSATVEGLPFGISFTPFPAGTYPVGIHSIIGYAEAFNDMDPVLESNGDVGTDFEVSSAESPGIIENINVDDKTGFSTVSITGGQTIDIGAGTQTVRDMWFPLGDRRHMSLFRTVGIRSSRRIHGFGRVLARDRSISSTPVPRATAIFSS
jgi:hypothetical protein